MRRSIINGCITTYILLFAIGFSVGVDNVSNFLLAVSFVAGLLAAATTYEDK